MQPPDVTAARAALPPALDLAAFGLAVPPVAVPPDPQLPDPLAPWVAAANAMLPGLTGWQFDAVPTGLEPLFPAIAGTLALKLATDMSPDRFETLIDFDLLSAFSAGSYSETRRTADDAEKARKLGLTGWPGLDFLIVQAMSPDKREEYQALLLGYNAPAWLTTEVDWEWGDAFRPLEDFARPYWWDG